MRAIIPLTIISLTLAGCGESPSAAGGPAAQFDGALALEAVQTQLDFGPRVPGTEAHEACASWLLAELGKYADSTFADRWVHTTVAGESLPLANIHAVFNPQATRRALFCAHWDTRPKADQDSDPSKAGTPIPGANDGGSGVAVLLELARVLASSPPEVGVDIVLFDGEDFGDFHLPGDVLLGSIRFAQTHRRYRPRIGVLLDMVGDANAKFPYEGNSWDYFRQDVQLVWDTARELGYGSIFVNQSSGYVIDDHIPLRNAGIRCIDVIQMGLPYWHTTADTIDKLSASSLEAVGRTMAEVIRKLGE